MNQKIRYFIFGVAAVLGFSLFAKEIFSLYYSMSYVWGVLLKSAFLSLAFLMPLFLRAFYPEKFHSKFGVFLINLVLSIVIVIGNAFAGLFGNLDGLGGLVTGIIEIPALIVALILLFFVGLLCLRIKFLSLALLLIVLPIAFFSYKEDIRIIYANRYQFSQLVPPPGNFDAQTAYCNSLGYSAKDVCIEYAYNYQASLNSAQTAAWCNRHTNKYRKYECFYTAATALREPRLCDAILEDGNEFLSRCRAKLEAQ
jgi:hypothetical protein